MDATQVGERSMDRSKQVGKLSFCENRKYMKKNEKRNKTCTSVKQYEPTKLMRWMWEDVMEGGYQLERSEC